MGLDSSVCLYISMLSQSFGLWVALRLKLLEIFKILYPFLQFYEVLMKLGYGLTIGFTLKDRSNNFNNKAPALTHQPVKSQGYPRSCS